MSTFVPRLLADKFNFLPANLATDEVRKSLHAYPGVVPEAWTMYLSRGMRAFHLAGLLSARLQAAQIRACGQPKAAALASFVEFQSVISLTGLALRVDPECPPDLSDLYRWGAGQLHIYGGDQSECLALVAARVVRWCTKQAHRCVLIVDSPLGGTVPAHVLAAALRQFGVDCDVREFLSPRLDRGTERFSVTQAADKFRGALPAGEYPIIFPDEVLTGTRFRKLLGALKRHFSDQLVPIALSVDSWSGAPQDNKQRQRLATKLQGLDCANQGAPTFTSFPPAALIRIDEHQPITLSAPFFWAEQDICAGKRKVNLVFSLIDQMKRIAKDLKNENGTSVSKLEQLWRQSTDGRVVIGAEPFLRQIVSKFVPKIDWEAIDEEARRKFKDEYTGTAPPTKPEGVKERFDWLMRAVYEQLLPLCITPQESANEAGVVVNALDNLYSLAHGGPRLPLPRDRDFCEGTIPLAYPDHVFHDELVALVVAQVPELYLRLD